MGFLANKRALVLGIASKKSIAYGIARAMHSQGAEVAITFQNERLKERAQNFASELSSPFFLECDVDNDDHIAKLFEHVNKEWEEVDIIVHSIAFAPREMLHGNYLDNLTKEGFRIAHETSSYSFAAIGKAASPYLSKSAALLTLSYIGAVRAMPSYKIMGVAKASLEASIKYMAAN